MSEHKWGCKIRRCDDGDWIVADATERYWLRGNGLWEDYYGPIPWTIGNTIDEASAVALLDRSVPPPTYAAPHIEVKPLADEADRHFTQAVEAFNELKKLYDRVVAERDAARAELKNKEEGK